MACKKKNRSAETDAETFMADPAGPGTKEPSEFTLMFGVDSKIPANDLLQNNLELFEWVVRNKMYPNYWARNIIGENALTKEEISYIHGMGCKIAAIYETPEAKETEEQGEIHAKKINVTAFELGIPAGSAIFLSLDDAEPVTTDYIRGYARALIAEGFTPGLKANTDAKFAFDREFSRGMQTDRELFSQCVIWAVAPKLVEYDRLTTSHWIHPDNWKPFAPSGITRGDIAVWQYGCNCHPIQNDAGKETSFNLDLVKNSDVVVHKMF